MQNKDLITAVEKHGLDRTHAEKAVNAVFAALRDAPVGVLVFRAVEGRSVAPDKRRTIFMCG